MAKSKNTRPLGANKPVAALTLAVALVLTVLFGYLGVTGKKLDSEGLYKLLPWLPTPGEAYEWREALKPGADFGSTDTYLYAASDDREAAAADAKTLEKRVRVLGAADVVAEVTDGGKILLTLPKGVYTKERVEWLTETGLYTFSDDAGADFLTGDHITRAALAPQDQSADNWALTFEFDEEGKKVFAEKTAELIGKNVIIKKDGLSVVTAGISEALKDGGASIPGFAYEDALKHAVLMNSGALQNALTLEKAEDGAPMLGEHTLDRVVLGMWIAVAAAVLYLIVSYRMAGVVASWTLLLALGFTWFFAALLRRGFSLMTFLAVLAAFVLCAWGVLTLFHGMKKDLRNGRAAKQALKASYGSFGHTVLEVHAAALLLAVILIIADRGSVGTAMRLFAIGVMVNMAALFIALRVLMTSASALFGEKTALYVSGGKKENA